MLNHRITIMLLLDRELGTLNDRVLRRDISTAMARVVTLMQQGRDRLAEMHDPLTTGRRT